MMTAQLIEYPADRYLDRHIINLLAWNSCCKLDSMTIAFMSKESKSLVNVLIRGSDRGDPNSGLLRSHPVKP